MSSEKDRTPYLNKPRDLNGHAHLVTGCAPPGAGPEHKVIQLKAGGAIEGVILAHAVWGVLTHWNVSAGRKGRSERCTMEKLGECSGCDRELPSRWKGYIHYFDFLLKAEAFLEITPGVFDQLKDNCPKGTTLRGLRIRAKRGEGGNTARLALDLLLFTGDMERFGPAKDPEPILETLWNWRR